MVVEASTLTYVSLRLPNAETIESKNFGTALASGHDATVLGPFRGHPSDGETRDFSKLRGIWKLGTQYFIRLGRVRYHSVMPCPSSAYR